MPIPATPQGRLEAFTKMLETSELDVSCGIASERFHAYSCKIGRLMGVRVTCPGCNATEVINIETPLTPGEKSYSGECPNCKEEFTIVLVERPSTRGN